MIRWGAAAIAITLIVAAAPAVAVERSAVEVEDLAERAATDTAAFNELLATTSIDGVPVDLEPLLSDNLDRVAAMASQEPPVGWVSDPAAAAGSILSQSRFSVEGGVPLSSAISAWLARVVGRMLQAMDTAIPGGIATLGWVLLFGAVAGVSAVAISLLRRRERSIERIAAGAERTREQPRLLEREAERAEREGRFEASLRLRFRAALIRLDRNGMLRFHEGVTSGQVIAAVDHHLVPGLVGTHDEVVYGDRTPTSADADESASGWPKVVRETTP